MKLTLSIIKADIGSIGGHTRPSEGQLQAVRDFVGTEGESAGVIDSYISFTGDDIAILMSHQKGIKGRDIHKLAWDAFKEGTKVAKEEGLYAAGQDLLKDAFAGNVVGMGPAVAELEFEMRPAEAFLFFAADKTDPGAYNLPLYLMFADPMYSSGLLLSPKIKKGFKFFIMDVNYTRGDKIIELSAPEELYDIAALLRDNERFVVESVWSRFDPREQVAAISTTRLHNIAGTYTGKDDPVMLIRAQQIFPATEEIVYPFSIGHFVGGDSRGSHVLPLLPMPINSPVDFVYCHPIVSSLAFSITPGGKLGEPVDMFAGKAWDPVRDRIIQKALEMKRQGFSGAAMLPYSELEYGGIKETLTLLDKRFKVKPNANSKRANKK